MTSTTGSLQISHTTETLVQAGRWVRVRFWPLVCVVAKHALMTRLAADVAINCNKRVCEWEHNWPYVHA